MATKIHNLSNCNVYVDGNNLLGRANEVQAPDVKFMYSEHSALGLQSKIDFFSGVEKLESKIKWNSLYPDALKLVSNPTKAIQLQIRGSMDVQEPQGRVAELPVVYTLTGTAKNLPMGSFKQNENIELETTFNIIEAKMEVDGETIFDYSAIANVLSIGGEDIFANNRANLGI